MITPIRQNITNIYEWLSTTGEFIEIKKFLLGTEIITDDFLFLTSELANKKSNVRNNLTLLSHSVEELDGVIKECELFIHREKEKENNRKEHYKKYYKKLWIDEIKKERETC
jgi:hypothetical protein